MPRLTRTARSIAAAVSSGLLAALIAASPAAAAELNVVVTIKPVHALATAVMEGAGTPALLIDGAGSPHTYALKPSEAARLNRADLVVRVSEALEPFTAKLFKSLPRSARTVTLADTPGLTLHAQRAGGGFEAHAHGDAKGGHAGHGHGHGAARGGKPAGGAAVDGHLWLDPLNAKVIAVRLAEELAGRDPAGAARYRANAAALGVRLEALDAELRQTLSGVSGRRAIVFHDAYQYFEARYGLAVAGSISVNPEQQPGARRLTEIREKIRATGGVCVFAEPQFEPRIVTTLIEGTSARSATLDPLGSALPAGPEQYFQAMRALAAGFKACLAGTS